MAETLPDHDMVDLDTATAIKLPYPEFSVLKDGKEGEFLPQIGGDAGAERVYRGWAAKVLEADPDGKTSLSSVFDHLRSTFTPPPGIFMIQDASGLLPYLPAGNASTPRKKSSNKAIKADTYIIEGFRLKQPTFDDMSDVWKSVGMSLLRWALAAFERDRADSMEHDHKDQGGRAGSSSRGEESPTVSGSNSNSNDNSLDGVADQTSTRNGSANSPRNEVDGQDAFGLAVLPDSAFVITSPNALPFPEICVRRNIDTEPAVQHQGSDTKPKTTATQKDTEMMDGAETMETTCEPQKIRKKALYAEQRIGPEGSRTVALAWLNAVTIPDNDPSTAHYTRIDSIYNLYRAYAYHPFRCPVLDHQAFEEVLIQAVGAGGILDELYDVQVEPDIDDINGDDEMQDKKTETDEDDASGSVSNATTTAKSAVATTPLPTISRTAATAEPTIIPSTSTKPSDSQPTPNSRSRLIRLIIRPPDKVIQKSHEAIWESIGMNWKKARTFGWDERRMVGTRKREVGGTQGRAQVKLKVKEGSELEEEQRQRRNTGMNSGMSMGAGAGRTVYNGAGTNTIPGLEPRPGPGPGLGIRTEMAPNSASMRTPGPPTLRPVEVRPRVPVGLPGRVSPDFVTIWLSQNYRPAPFGCGRSTPQKELWQDYTQLVRYHSGLYESDLRRYGALKERVDAMARAMPYPPDSTITTTITTTSKAESQHLYQTQIVSQELARLTQLHRALGYYMDLQPAGLFGLVSEMFGCTLGRMGDGGYGLDGLERVWTGGRVAGGGGGVKSGGERGGAGDGRGAYNGDVRRDGMR